MPTLDLALVGNGTIGALVSPDAEIVWTCLPRFDGDPVFCSLLRGSAEPKHDGAFGIEMIGSVRSEQQYVPDTPVLVTRFFDAAGAGIQNRSRCDSPLTHRSTQSLTRPCFNLLTP